MSLPKSRCQRPGSRSAVPPFGSSAALITLMSLVEKPAFARLLFAASACCAVSNKVTIFSWLMTFILLIVWACIGLSLREGGCGVFDRKASNHGFVFAKHDTLLIPIR